METTKACKTINIVTDITSDGNNNNNKKQTTKACKTINIVTDITSDGRSADGSNLLTNHTSISATSNDDKDHNQGNDIDNNKG